MSMLKFEQTLIDFRSLSFWRRHRIGLAVSGGADSTALFCSFARLAHREGFADALIAVHVNHGVRGAESDGDADFVRELAAQYAIAFDQRSISSKDLQRQIAVSGTFEGAARDLRYQLLREMTGSFGARYLVTAHTKDDQLETILYRIFRGTGLEGLKAIPSVRPIDDALVLLRPVLSLGRSDVLDYLNQIGQNFREDSSNAETEYARNKIRHELVPLLEKIFPNRWSVSLERLSAHAADLSGLIEAQTDQIEAQTKVLHFSNKTVIDRGSLLSALYYLTSSSNRSSFENEGAQLEINSDLYKNIITESKTVFNWRHIKVKSGSTIRSDSAIYLLSEYFRRIWRRRNWHQNGMGRDQWLRLSEAVLTGEKVKSEFPGGITAEIDSDRIVFYF